MHPTMEDYRVDLDCYAGPLDLLLYLVRRHEIDLNDIPVARLTEQYLEHLKLIEQIDVNVAGEFLVMAATLLEIKSSMLIPRTEEAAPTDQPTPENPLDPRFELVQQLLAYKRYKDAANNLEQRRSDWESRFPRQPARIPDAKAASTPAGDGEGETDEPAAPIEIDLEDVHVLDLCEAFARILESVGHNASHQVVYDDTPIQLHADDIVDRLTRDGAMTLQQIFVGRSNRSEMIGLFLATLELVRQKRVRVLQDQPGSEIRLELRSEAERTDPNDDKAADWRDPATGEMQYEWPSEDARLRALRRAKLRATFAAKRRAGETVEEEEIIDVDDEPVVKLTRPPRDVEVADGSDEAAEELHERASDEPPDTEAHADDERA